jgi:hypothetical protein
LTQDIIGEQKRILQCGALFDDVEQTIVRNNNQSVDVRSERFDRFSGLLNATSALERERIRHDTYGQDALFAGQLGDDGRRTAPRASPHTGGDKYEIASHDGSLERFSTFGRRDLSKLRVTPGTETSRHLFTDLTLVRRERVDERLRIRVQSPKLDTLRRDISLTVSLNDRRMILSTFIDHLLRTIHPPPSSSRASPAAAAPPRSPVCLSVAPVIRSESSDSPRSHRRLRIRSP